MNNTINIKDSVTNKNIYYNSNFAHVNKKLDTVEKDYNVVINSVKENKVLATKRIFKNGNKCGFRKSKAIIIKLHDFLTNQHLKDSFVPNEII